MTFVLISNLQRRKDQASTPMETVCSVESHLECGEASPLWYFTFCSIPFEIQKYQSGDRSPHSKWRFTSTMGFKEGYRGTTRVGSAARVNLCLSVISFPETGQSG